VVSVSVLPPVARKSKTKMNRPENRVDQQLKVHNQLEWVHFGALPFPDAFDKHSPSVEDKQRHTHRFPQLHLPCVGFAEKPSFAIEAHHPFRLLETNRVWR
jgi:hypothetical protein